MQIYTNNKVSVVKKKLPKNILRVGKNLCTTKIWFSINSLSYMRPTVKNAVCNTVYKMIEQGSIVTGLILLI